MNRSTESWISACAQFAKGEEMPTDNQTLIMELVKVFQQQISSDTLVNIYHKPPTYSSPNYPGGVRERLGGTPVVIADTPMVISGTPFVIVGTYTRENHMLPY